MTDEEMAEKYAKANMHYKIAKRENGADYAKEVSNVTIKQAFLAGLEYKNKENAELEEKISILLSCKNCPENKGGWICAKEYEDKCLAQKIEFIKEIEKEKCELPGIIQGKDKVIQELKKELKKANEWHYVKDGIMPAENQWVLVYDGSYTVCNYHSYAPIKWLDNYENEVYEGAIIAWCEIPKCMEE